MKKLIFLVLLFTFNFTFSQRVIEQANLSESAIELTKQKVVYDPKLFLYRLSQW